MFEKDIVEFHKTFHGEFPTPGKICTLIRFRACNLRCPFCDTQHLMTPQTPPVFSESYTAIAQIVGGISHTRNILITGGEPGLYTGHVSDLINLLFETDVFIETIQVETNGLFLSSFEYLVDNLTSTAKSVILNNLLIVWSPKFVNEREIQNNFVRLYSDVTRRYLNNIVFKLLDVPEWHGYNEKFIRIGVELYGSLFKTKCALMAVTEADPETGKHVIDVEKARETLEKCLKWGINFSPRVHLTYSIP